MSTTTITRTRRDALATVFAYAVAGLALVAHAVSAVLDGWPSGEVVLEVTSRPEGLRQSLVLDAGELADGALVSLRAAAVNEWALTALVLVLLTTCVLRLVRGEVFTRSTARWASAAGWATASLLIVPSILRLGGTNWALQTVPDPDRWRADLVGEQFWYLYVGMMTLSFLALVLHRGARMHEDQEGLI